ncbi:MAG: hypothetical protein EOP08_04520, partial [Proteobacteria bacterium]
MDAFVGKPARALGTMFVLLALPYTFTKGEPFRVVRMPWEHRQTDDAPVETTSTVAVAPAVETGELEVRATDNQSANALPTGKDDTPAARPPTLPEGSFLERPEALSAFYTRLAKQQAGEKGVVRIAYYGDSIVTSDYLTGTARRLLQARFGDGGHGFLTVANPWEWYFHNDVAHSAGSGWRASRVTGPLTKDGDYGPGGVVFRGSAGATASFGTAKDGDYGRKVSRFSVLYATSPEGGALELKTTAGEATVLETKAGEAVAKVHSIDVPDGENKLTIRVLRGEVKIYGVALERESGLVLDALGALGARARVWEHLDGEKLAAVYKERMPALVAVQLGTNESEDGAVNVADYKATLGRLLDTFRKAAPEASLLLVAPPDRAEKSPSGDFRSNRVLTK